MLLLRLGERPKQQRQRHSRVGDKAAVFGGAALWLIVRRR
jgi:hypothetical protein